MNEIIKRHFPMPEPERHPSLDPEGYIDLDRGGVREAMNAGLLRPYAPPSGALCVRCGALVAAIARHDEWHAELLQALTANLPPEEQG